MTEQTISGGDGETTTTVKNWVNPPERALGGAGFLTADNFDGRGATSPNDFSLPILGLAAIDTSWLPSDKENNNIYEIDGDTEAHNADYAFAETTLWMLMDYNGYVNYMKNLSSSGVDLYFYNIAQGVDTEITVRDDTDITITLTDRTSGSVTVGTITNIGTTTQDSITANLDGTATNLPTFVAGVTETTMPAVPGNLDYVRDTLVESRNYIAHDEWSAPELDENGDLVIEDGQLSIVTYDQQTFYTDHYIYHAPVDDAYYDAYEVYLGQEIPAEDRTGYGYVEKNGDIYAFNVDTTGAVVLADTPVLEDTALVDSPLFLGNAEIFADPENTLLYSFNGYEQGIWVGDDRTYDMSQDASVYQALYSSIYLTEAPGSGAVFISGIGISFRSDQSTEVTEIRFSLGYSEDGYSYQVSNYSIDSFGQGATSDMAAAIEAAIAA